MYLTLNTDVSSWSKHLEETLIEKKGQLGDSVTRTREETLIEQS